MTEEGKKKLLKMWGPVCLICGQEAELKVSRCVESIALEAIGNGMPYIGNWYCHCQECEDKGELL